MLTFLDQTIVATILPAMSADLNAGASSSWFATAYLITSVRRAHDCDALGLTPTQMACTPLYGRISDIFGRKTVLLACLIEFWATSLLCAVAQTAIQLIVFRALQGIGGASTALAAAPR